MSMSSLSLSSATDDRDEDIHKNSKNSHTAKNTIIYKLHVFRTKQPISLTVCTIFPTAPSLNRLILMKWKDAQGQERRLKILEQISAEWDTVGLLLGQTMPMLQSYRTFTQDNVQCCRHVFYQWLKNSTHSEYPPTWEGVRTLLVDVGHKKTAEELKKAIASKGLSLT